MLYYVEYRSMISGVYDFIRDEKFESREDARDWIEWHSSMKLDFIEQRDWNSDESNLPDHYVTEMGEYWIFPDEG